MKHCNACGREVAETLHTQDGYKIDYYERMRDGVVTIMCVDCKQWLGVDNDLE